MVLLESRLERAAAALRSSAEAAGLEGVVSMSSVAPSWIVGGWGSAIFGGIGRWWVGDGHITGEFGGDGVDGADVGQDGLSNVGLRGSFWRLRGARLDWGVRGSALIQRGEGW